MKILFTTYQGGIAGSTFSIIYLSKGLADRGHEIHVGCDESSYLYSELKTYKGIECHHIPFASYFDVISARKVSLLSRKHQIQIVCPQGGRDRNLTIVAKWIFRMTSSLVFVRRQRPRDEPLIKRFLHTRATKCIVMVSQGLKEIFLQEGYRKNHLRVIHNGVDSDHFLPVIPHEQIDQLRQSLGISNEIVIGCVSRLKYQELVIRSLKHLPSDLVILFIGTSKSEMSTIIEHEKPHQRLIFLDEVSRKDLPAYYQLMTISILASKMDGFGLVLVESMLSQVPVVASRFGGIPDVVEDGVTGSLFDNDKPEEFSDRISELLNNPKKRERMIRKAKETALKKFDIGLTIDNYEKLFLELTEND